MFLIFDFVSLCSPIPVTWTSKLLSHTTATTVTTATTTTDTIRNDIMLGQESAHAERRTQIYIMDITTPGIIFVQYYIKQK